MKNRRLTKIIAVILALTVVFSAVGVSAGASRAYDIVNGDFEAQSDNVIMVILSDILDMIVRFLLNLVSGWFGDAPGFVSADDVASGEVDVSENFFEGRSEFADSAAEDDKWFIGYANTSLVPDDVTNGNYFLGGYIAIENGFTNVVEGVIDDMKARCVAITTGTEADVATHTDNGTALFATIDCIGITNADIKDIRAMLADFAEENNIVSINVASAHCHSGIDTEGLWTHNIVKILNNGIISGLDIDRELQQGTNPEYMKFLKQRVADALKEAYLDMKPGTLTYSSKDVGQDYFTNKNRPSSGEYTTNKNGEIVKTFEPNGDPTIAMTEINRFIFTPDDGSRPTMMVNMNAHPDVTGLPTESNSGREVSGDYVYYIGEYLDNYKGEAAPNGYNFMFFQGAIAGIYMGRGVANDNVDREKRYEEAKRYGYEIARICLAMNKTEEELLADEYNCVADFNKDGTIKTTIQQEIDEYYYQLTDEDGKLLFDDEGNPKMSNYTIWYKDWQPVEVEDVEPFFNIRLKQSEVRISNDLIETAGKLNLANYQVITNTDANGQVYYTTYTEVGFVQFGNSFMAVMMPGEICQDLIVDGSSLYAKFASTCRDASYYMNGVPTYAKAIFGIEDLKCFGLCNDAIGYVVPQNDFTQGNPADHYHEFISLGEYVGTDLLTTLNELASELAA